MRVNRDQFMEDGYVILRDVIPPDKLEETRATYEALLEKQKVVWVRDRKPDDPPGGRWETAPQPRVVLWTSPDLIDETTAGAVDVWLHESTLGVSSQLLCLPEASVAGMYMMANPVRDHGPAKWHRDIHPADMAPLGALQAEMIDNGPRYVQWNIPLYDDNVLWVVPGSHRRLNTDQEDRQLLADPRVPLDNGLQVELNAGDGVAYTNYLIHWGSNYTAKLRRTIHGGHSIFPYFDDISFTEYLSASARETFERWDRRSAKLQELTESALRASIGRDATAYRAALHGIQPGAGEKGRLVLTIYLCKLALFVYGLKGGALDSLHDELRRRATSSHTITLNWGPQFAERFSADEADLLWERFKGLDRDLQADEEQFVPGFQSGPMPYYFNEAPEGLTVDSFVSSWAT